MPIVGLVVRRAASAEAGAAMTMIGLIVWLALVGLIVWVLVTYIPMPAPIRRAIVAIAVVLMILWTLEAIGVWGWPGAPIQVE